MMRWQRASPSSPRTELAPDCFRDLTVRENLSAAWNELRGHIVQGESDLARGLVKRLGVVTPTINQEVRRLSGGNQQKVVIGRWLAIDAKAYIFDEPTKGVDVGAKHDIYGFIADLLREGRAVIIVSSDSCPSFSRSATASPSCEPEGSWLRSTRGTRPRRE